MRAVNVIKILTILSLHLSIANDLLVNASPAAFVYLLSICVALSSACHKPHTVAL